MDFLYSLCVTVKTLLHIHVDHTCAWCLWNSEEGVGSHEIEVKGSCESLYGWNIEEQEISIQWQARKPVNGANTQICFSWCATCAIQATPGHVGKEWAGWTLGYSLFGVMYKLCG